MSSRQLSNLGILGHTGRLGSAICLLATSRQIGVTLRVRTGYWLEEAKPQVLINAASGRVLENAAEYCEKHAVPYVEACSGLNDTHLERLRKLSETVAVLRAENFSFAHYLQLCVTRFAAGLISGYDGECEVSVIDRHGTFKKDSPSATAKLLSRTWKASSSVKNDPAVWSVRAGLPVCDHSLNLTFPGESLELKHSVTERTAYAQGALQAAAWIADKEPGLWHMQDVYSNQIKNERYNQKELRV